MFTYLFMYINIKVWEILILKRVFIESFKYFISKCYNEDVFILMLK